MKIEKICISIFITLVLSLCSAQYSPYFITRFEHLDALLTHSYYKTGCTYIYQVLSRMYF